MAGTKRLGIYTIKNSENCIFDYVWYFIGQLREVTDYLIIIYENDMMKEDNLEKLQEIADKVMHKKEPHFLQWSDIELICQKSEEPYKQIIYADSSIFGPFFSLEIFMQQLYDKKYEVYGISEERNQYLESAFIVIGRELISFEGIAKISKCLIDNSISKIKLDEEKICYQVCNSEILRNYPQYYIKANKFPFLPVEYFTESYGDILERNSGEALAKVVKYLRDKTEYDTEMIWKYLLKVANLADIKKIMQCNYILSSQVIEKERQNKKMRIALILHIYYEELAVFCRKYAESMPEGTDVYVTVPTKEKLEFVKKAFENFPYNVEYRIVGNIGRDVGPFIVGCKDIIFNYDLVCKMHDKKVYQVAPMSVGESWAYKCFENMLKNKIYVENIISTFEDNPSLGMLTPPIPMHGPYYPTVGFGEWSTNFQITKKLADSLGLTVPIQENKEPVAPLGSMFWFRPESLKCLFAHDWEYDELPKEPIAVDATILHGIERIYPFCMQQEGYYSAWVMVDTYARIELDNWRYYNGELQRAESAKVTATSHKKLLEKIRNL
ncbi:MAG: rhamnan synthesis F family protein [Lachnospiraceae bacterium]|nr:rhamnan synthesis F family protein [Lachnospiraceae bacterium]